MIKKLFGLLALLTVAYSAHAEVHVQAVADENLLGADTRVAQQELVRRQAANRE